ncbi:type II toxin-antitoxin system RelE/ParE family toxin [Ruania alba]|uniref:mRNA-degrading endonuclease RelE, toxin component of the RelBE toxin-antitoxin system n=1 Tax=Ruania alba TaxID=648782 RepID=A0A1H5NB05_9MICO|nr:mRNA-degrading endonuclease RelE, toxin component of the RelBE toxin-antitoxin system [Ruania alba]
MTFEVRFSGGARSDVDRVIAGYAVEAPMQVPRFVDELLVCARRLEVFPYSAPELRRSARRVSLRVFPYQLWYRVDDESQVVEVVAVFHHRRDPAHAATSLERVQDMGEGTSTK